MKKKREIIQHRAPITDKEISQSKPEFDSIMNQYTSTQMANGSSVNGLGKIINSLGKWGVGLISAAVIGTGIWFVTSSENTDDQLTQENPTESLITPDSATTQYINPPLPYRNKEEVFAINNRKKINIETRNGSIISIPAKAFVDKEGNPVTRNIDIQYSEFHNPLEIFLSGIPMNYDSAGTEYNFESAGMIKMLAKHNGQDIYLAANKEIEIELVSKQTEPYNIYEFDTLKGTWKYTAHEDRKDIQNLEEKLALIDTKLNEKEDLETDFAYDASAKGANTEFNYQRRPRKATLRNQDRFAMNIEDQGDLSGVYEIETGQDFKQEYYTVRWQGVYVAKNDDNENYTVSLRRGNTTLEFECYPVLEKEEYEEAIQNYDQDLEESSERIEKNRGKTSEIRQLRKLKDRTQQLMNNQFLSTRRLTVVNLGTMNLDKAVEIPEPQLATQLNKTLTDEEGNILKYTSVQVAQLNKNILWSYPKGFTPNYSKVDKNILWCLTIDNKVGVLLPNDFANLGSSKKIALHLFPIEEGMLRLESYFN